MRPMSTVLQWCLPVFGTFATSENGSTSALPGSPSVLIGSYKSSEPLSSPNLSNFGGEILGAQRANPAVRLPAVVFH